MRFLWLVTKHISICPSPSLTAGKLGYGLGTANFKAGNKDKFDQKIVDDTLMAIKAGYYHLDGAEGTLPLSLPRLSHESLHTNQLPPNAAYGNEAELGAAIAQSGVPRSRLFITTKTSCRAGETVETAFSRSLEKLGVEYVDLYLIHSPFSAERLPEDLQQRWAEMEAIRDSGRARSIGVSNFLREHLDAVLATARHPPALNQIEYHPYLQHTDGLVEYHREKGVAVAAYSPLAAVVRAAPGPVDGVYERLAGKYGVGKGEVALRWCLDQGIVAITTSGNEERLKNFLAKVPRFKLTPKEVDEVAERGREKHYRCFWTNKFAADDRR